MRRTRHYSFVLRSALLLLALVAGSGWTEETKKPEPAAPGSLENALENVPLYDLKGLDAMPRAIHQVRPIYPFELRRAGITGEAVVGFIVDSQGLVSHAYAIRADHEDFGKSAVAAVMKWLFEPGKVNGRPVNTRMQVPLMFHITPEAPSRPPAPDPYELGPKGYDEDLPLVDLVDLDAPPKPTYQEKPVFPPELRRQQITGRAVVGFIVNSQGSVVQAYAVQADHEDFAAAAVAAVSQWRITPGTVDGQLVNTRMQVPVVFNIVGDPPKQNTAPSLAPDLPAPNWDEAPSLASHQPPKYPAAMRRLAGAHQVTVRFTLNRSGRVRHPYVVASTNPGFDEAAVAAIKKWKFKPAKQNGKAVETVWEQTVGFRQSPESARSHLRFLWPQSMPASIPDEYRWDVPPLLTYYEPPVFPRKALMDHREGEVTLGLTLDKFGTVSSVQPQGAADADLQAAAMAAAHSFRFRAAQKRGQPCGAIIVITFDFSDHRDTHAPVSKNTLNIVSKLKRGLARSALFSEDDLDAPMRATLQREPDAPPGDGGTAMIQFVVDEHGFARVPLVVHESRPGLGLAAAQAVNAWRFEPPLRKGKPVDTVVTKTLHF